jgi:hypothetical protein
MSSMIPYGNLQKMVSLSLTLSPASVAANTTAEQTFTCPGVRAGDVVLTVNKPTAQAGLGIVGYRVSATDQVAITFSNNTAAPIVPTASQVYAVTIGRLDSASAYFS